MDRNANLARPAPHTRKAGAIRDNDYETSEDDLVDHRRQEPSQQSNRRSVPRKPPRKVPSAPPPADVAARAASFQKPPSPHQTSTRSTVFIHPNRSPPSPPPSTKRPPISKIPPAPLPPIPPTARSSTNNLSPVPVVPTIIPKIPPLAYHRTAPLVPRTAFPQAPPPVPNTVSYRANPPVPGIASARAPPPNPPSAFLQVHLQSLPTPISRPSIPPPPPPLGHTRHLPSSQFTAPHPTQYSTLSVTSSIQSDVIPSHSLSTIPSGSTMSNIYSLSNSQPSPSCHSLSSVHLSPLNTSCSAPDTGTPLVSDPSFPAQQSQHCSTSGSAQRQSTETPPAVREPSSPCHTYQNEAYSSSHGATDMKGMLLKLVDGKWKARYFVLRSKFWVMEYYHKMADAQSKSEGLRGVYPLLGAQTSGLVEVDKGFQFILTLRTSQMIQLKLPEKTAIERWRQSIQATTQHPLPNFIGEGKTGAVELLQSRQCTARNIWLNFMTRYLCIYKKTPEDMMPGLDLLGAHVTMEKGYKKRFDITIINTSNTDRTMLRFQTLEEWVFWGTALESCAISK